MKAGTRVPTVEIEISPRVHIGLISMHAGAPRKNGGLGFALEGPTASIRATRADELRVLDLRPTPMGVRELASLDGQLRRIMRELDLSGAATLEIGGELLTHCGMGSGTAMRLACIESLLEINRRSTDRRELIRLSGRGGTSGVGISTYFDGGFALDLGVAGDTRDRFMPSSVGSGGTLPLHLHRQRLPHWPLGLCLPRKCKFKTQEEEVEFFRRSTPLPPAKSFEAAYVAVFHILGSLIERDYETFCRGVDAMQATEWKRLERAEYLPHLDRTDRELRELGVDCVGMSSLGPLLYFFAAPETLERVRAHSDKLDADIVVTAPRNTGRRLTSY